MTFDSIFVMRPLLGSVSPPRSIWLIYSDGRSQFPLLPFCCIDAESWDWAANHSTNLVFFQAIDDFISNV